MSEILVCPVFHIIYFLKILKKDKKKLIYKIMKNLLIFEDFKEVLIVEKNIPTNSELWNSCKAWAKSKYDVWPSAYACGAAAKRYKSKGGKWKKAKKKKK